MEWDRACSVWVTRGLIVSFLRPPQDFSAVRGWDTEKTKPQVAFVWVFEAVREAVPYC